MFWLRQNVDSPRRHDEHDVCVLWREALKRRVRRDVVVNKSSSEAAL